MRQGHLAPLLQAALKSLHLQLEEELIRYQQQRTQLTPDAVLLASLEEELSAETSDQKASNGSEPLAKPTSLVHQHQDELASRPPTSDSLLDYEERSPLAQLAPQRNNRLFTPLGVGSMLLTLVASVLLGTALINPRLDQRSPGEPPEAEPLPASLKPSNDVNDRAENPSTLQEAPAEAPANEQEYSDLTSALLPPSLRPQVQPQTASPTLSPILKPTQPPASVHTNVPDARIEPNYYYVLVEDISQAALQQAQNVVQEASLKKFPQGVRIQMGTFTSPEAANQLVQRLQQQGISASIYHSRE